MTRMLHGLFARRGALVGLMGVASACASTPRPTLDPTPTGQASVQAVPANEAAVDFQIEADAIKQMSQPLDWDNVALRMEGVVRKHPRYGLAWYNLGVAYHRLGRRREAADAYRRALAANESLREAQLNLASLAVDKGDGDEAVLLLEALVDRDTGAVGARIALASYRLEQGDLDEAERLAKEALARAPERLGGYCVLARLFVRKKKRGRARLVVAQGLKIDPDAACLHLALGQVLLAEGETAGGLAALERAVKKEPTLSEARFLIAETSMAFKDFNRAIVHYRAVAERDAKPGPALVNLGVAYKGSGQFEEAEKAYLSATKHSESAPAAHFNLGVLYLRHFERLEAAEENLRRYVELAGGGAEDQAAALLNEVEQMKQFRQQEAEMEAEAKRQAEAEASPKADENPSVDDVGNAGTPPIPAPAPRKRKSPKKAPTRGSKPPPKDLQPDDFE